MGHQKSVASFYHRELRRYNPRPTKPYLIREDFSRIRSYTSATWASKFLREWCIRAVRSRIESMQMIAKTLRRHEPLLLMFRTSGTFLRSSRRRQQQSEIDHGKSVRFQGSGNHFHPTISSAWQLSRAKTNLQILLTRHFLSVWIREVFSIVAEQTVS
jgi:hypothetical protein